MPLHCPLASHSPVAELRRLSLKGSLRILSIGGKQDLIFVLLKALLIDHMANGSLSKASHVMKSGG